MDPNRYHGKCEPKEQGQMEDHGISDTFAIDSTGLKSIAISFSKTFTETPNILANVAEVSDETARFNSLMVQSPTINGCTVKVNIATAGAGASTAKISWKATGK